MQLASSADLHDRALGSALLQAEPLSLAPHADADHIAYRGRLTLTLGFYSEPERRLVEKFEEKAAHAISAVMVGEMAPDLQLSTQILEEQEWWTKKYQSPLSTSVRLHTLMNASQVSANPKSAIVLRRLRYRVGNDHNGQVGSATDLIVWSTPTTRRWATEISSDPSRPGRVPADVGVSSLTNSLGHGSTDWAQGDSDDWGAVAIANNPLKVLELTTPTGKTKDDVAPVLRAAGPSIVVERSTLPKNPGQPSPLRDFANSIARLAADPRALKDADILLCHRGGGIIFSGNEANVSQDDIDSLATAVLSVRDLGVEVILGLGHGNRSCLPPGFSELGIFEATTPTAAAAWLVSEHVSSRLVDNYTALKQ